MTIIVFLVDTSASMQQRSWISGRSTFLDIAKGAVEFFVKLRQKSPESRGDRYMLLTFEEYPRNIKAGWKENLQTFMSELKNLEANGMTTMGTALKQVFDILNINRMQTGIDMYGQGRYPFYLEPAVILVISDGGKLTTQGSVQAELNLPMHSSVPGSELTREPFRWDQRLYALVLRMAGTPPHSQESGHVANDYSSIDAMCEVTGGRSYAVTSHRMLHQCIDSLVQKLQSGVVIHFEKIGPEPPPPSEEALKAEEIARADTVPLDDLDLGPVAKMLERESNGSIESRPATPNPILAPSNVSWHGCRKLIYVPRSAQKGFAVGFWPLPEAFWPDVSAPALPQRSAHPNIKFMCANQEPMIIDNLPFDKYELEPSPLTQYILARKQPNVCWQVFIAGSSRSPDMPNGAPFGYLKASTKLLTVNLFVLPYNYPVLLPLLDDLFKLHRLRPTQEWRAGFHVYLRTMPAYYAAPLRRVLTRMGAGNLANSLIPETMDNCLGYSVLNYLKRLKNQAKLEFDKTLSNNSSNGGSSQKNNPRSLEGMKVLARSPLKRDLLMNHLIKDKFLAVREQLTDFPGFQINIKDQLPPSNGFRNPYDIERKDLLDQIIRMRANFLQPSSKYSKLIDDDTRHTLPISQMGNYQDHLKKMPMPLREIESAPVRQHMFGNPFKINKNMIMDEVVMDEVSLVPSGSPGASPKGIKRPVIVDTPSPMGSKRMRKGPLPKDFMYRRPSSSASSSPSASPVHIKELDSGPDLTPPPTPEMNDTETKDTKETIEPLEINKSEVKSEPPEQPPILPAEPVVFAPETKPIVPPTLPSIPIPPSIEPSTIPEEPVNNENNEPELNNGSKSPAKKKTEDKNLAKKKEEKVKVMDVEERRKVETRNNNMRQIIYKEVKRPGRNYDKLLELLKELHGPAEIRQQYILDVIKEATRFKRNHMAQIILQNMPNLVSFDSTN